jgi:hypothetical protein
LGGVVVGNIDVVPGGVGVGIDGDLTTVGTVTAVDDMTTTTTSVGQQLLGNPPPGPDRRRRSACLSLAAFNVFWDIRDPAIAVEPATPEAEQLGALTKSDRASRSVKSRKIAT